MKKALFLDRDGVINLDRGYVHRSEQFEFLEGIFELCRSAQSLGYLLIVVTNQAGIARQYYTISDFEQLTDWMKRRFREQGVEIAQVYYCPYHPEHGRGVYRRDSNDRKPNPGMLLRAQADFGLDLANSVLIGDQLSDIQAAHAAGVRTAILLEQKPAKSERPAGSYHAFASLDEIRRNFFLTADQLDRPRKRYQCPHHPSEFPFLI